MITTDALARPGRRDRNMQDKHGRIFQAAAALFEAHGYAGVTTQAISERADVGAGTLFRYASSKDELLLMVLNQALRAAPASSSAITMWSWASASGASLQCSTAWATWRLTAAASAS